MQHAIVVFRIKWVWIWLRLSGARVPSRGAFFGRIEDPSFQKKKIIESNCGLRYSIVFIDQVTRSACTYYMSKKSDAAEKLKRCLSYVKKLGWCVGLIRADRGSVLVLVLVLIKDHLFIKRMLATWHPYTRASFIMSVFTN